MSFNPKSAKSYSSKADTQERQRNWAKIANNVIKGGGSESTAIRVANAAVAKAAKREEGK